MTPTIEARIDEQMPEQRIAALETELREVRTGRVEIVREPLVYERHDGHKPKGERHSYFADRAMAEINGDERAMQRLQRHAAQMDVELPRLQRKQAPPDVEMRVNPNRVDGQGGYFAPPLWANEYFATAPRPKRVLAHMIPNFDLPPGVAEVKLPRIISGNRADDKVDGVPNAGKDFTDGVVEAPAMTVAGQSDVSLQDLEQSPHSAALDFVLLKDLLESYDFHVEENLFVGESVGKQEFVGMLDLSTGAGGVSKVEYTSGSPTAVAMYLALGKVTAQLGDARKIQPQVVLMRTARWSWIGSGEDKEELPLAVPAHTPPPAIPYLFDDNVPTPVSAYLGWPIYLSDAIPAKLGAGENQDAIVACRPSDSMLFESPKRTSVKKEVLSGTLQARIELHAYAAALFRYPTGIATLTGTGLIVQEGY
jgi:hypothetical protein